MTPAGLARRIHVNAVGVAGALAVVCALATGAAKLATVGPLWAQQVGVCWAVFHGGRKALVWALSQIEAGNKEGWR